MHIQHTRWYSLLSLQHVSALFAILLEFLHKVLKLAKIRQITFVISVVKYIITQLRSVRRVVTYSLEEKNLCLYFKKTIFRHEFWGGRFYHIK